MTNTTYNSSDKSANITLSGSSLIATATSSSVGGVRSVDGYTSGKFYFEFKPTVLTGTNTGIGIARGDADYAAIGSTVALACECFKSGAIWFNGSASGLNIGTYVANDIICVALDLDNKRIWFRKGASGNWNGSSSNDPTTPSTGLDITAFVKAGFAFFISTTLNANSDSVTINVGDTSFTGTVPTGFTSGWPVNGSPLGTVAVASQAGAEVWVNNPGDMRASQVGTEVWFKYRADLIASQVGVEAWTSVGSVAASTTGGAALLVGL